MLSQWDLEPPQSFLNVIGVFHSPFPALNMDSLRFQHRMFVAVLLLCLLRLQESLHCPDSNICYSNDFEKTLLRAMR